MTRFVVFREETEPIQGTFVAFGSMRVMLDGSVAVVFANNEGGLPIGRAKDFERDETGAISFEIEFRENMDAREECFSVYADHLVERKEGDRRIILEATIRQLYFMPLPGFPPAEVSRNLQAS